MAGGSEIMLQVGPVSPCGHKHVNVPCALLLTQVLPIWHGLEEHGVEDPPVPPLPGMY